MFLIFYRAFAMGQRQAIVALLVAGMMLLPGKWGGVMLLQANPTGGTVAGGSANISTGPGQVTVTQQSDRAVVNWGSFSIKQGETTTFVQPGAKSAVLNRVTGSSVSQLDGSLKANGQVFLVNKNGVVVGKTGRVNTAGFTASTHDVADAQFMGGGDLTFSGSSSASVVNYGKIKATAGDVTLIARRVENHGKISAKKGQVVLAGGSEVLVKPSGTEGQRVFIRSGSGSVMNTGSIRATAAELRAAGGNEYALAVNNTGIIRATGVDKSGGRIVLKAEQRDVASGMGGGTAQNSGKLIARSSAPGKNGGTVAVTGDNVRLTKSSVIDASSRYGKGGEVKIGGGFQGKDATVSNAKTTVVETGSVINSDGHGVQGGTAIIWSDERTDFQGSILARGGDGGFVEVSSKGLLNFAGMVDTGGGTLLLDPQSITISNGITTSLTSGPTSVVATMDSVLNAADLVRLLQFNNISLQATSFIAVTAEVDAAAFNHSLTLDTATLYLNAGIKLGSGTLSGTSLLTRVYLNTGGLIQNGVDAVTAGGTVYLGAGTYQESHINIAKALTLTGTGAATTIVDGTVGPAIPSPGSVFVVDPGSGMVTFSGLSITGGADGGPADNGGAIRLKSGNFTLTNAKLFANAGTNGGGILTDTSGTLIIDRVTFDNNEADADGGGLYADGSGLIKISNSTFSANKALAGNGGGIRVGGGSAIQITGTTFSTNTSSATGGGLINLGSATIYDSTFQENTAGTTGGGIHNDRTLVVGNSTFDSNTATTSGGGGIAG
ncbi:MAG: filamentous hemagglutinin N-terminal domain-containing protein, partial [Candidatus Methylacidiphilales bacterium]